MECDFSDDDLPPAFETREPSTTKKETRSTKYRVEDLVWVKYRRCFWPAVVCQIYAREKKLKVMFVDAPDEKNLLKVPFRRVIAYNSSPKSCRMKCQVEMDSSPDRDALKEAIDKVDQYLCKRALRGSGISPQKFFMIPYCYIGNFDISEDADVKTGDDEEHVTDLQFDSGDVSIRDYPSDSDGLKDGENTSVLILAGQDNGDKKEKETHSADASCQARREADQLLKAIKTEDCTAFLLELYNGKVESRRHKVFKCGINSVRRGLKFESGFGPFEDSAQQDELCQHILEIFKQRADLAPYFDINGYLFDVLIPEAIMWALSKVLDLKHAQAEKVMVQGVRISSTRYEPSPEA